MSVQTGPVVHPASYTIHTGSFPGVKRPWHDVKHLPPYSTQVKGRVELHLYSPLYLNAGYRVKFTFCFLHFISLSAWKINLLNAPSRILQYFYVLSREWKWHKRNSVGKSLDYYNRWPRGEQLSCHTVWSYLWTKILCYYLLMAWNSRTENWKNVLPLCADFSNIKHETLIPCIFQETVNLTFPSEM